MSEINDKLVEFVRTALSFELSGEHFYRHAAEITQHPKGKAMFLRLAEQERAHGEEIGALFASIIGEHEWRRVSAEESSHPHPSALVERLEKDVAARAHGEVADDAQALRLALELERRAILFFDELATHTGDPALVEVIRKLADEERFHYDFIQGQLDSVQNVGVWMDSAEFRVDGRF
ncbi:MAG: ferritin family protein [Rhodocyclaceae bacterium]|nr:ferritin family protein [Rhodocyclaceae bacterium]